jgi:hypothetical protein
MEPVAKPPADPDPGAGAADGAEEHAGDKLADFSAVGPAPELADCLRLLALAERDGQARAEEASALRARAAESDRLAAELTTARQERDALLASTIWRLTAPVRVAIERLRRTGSRKGWALPLPSAGTSANHPRNESSSAVDDRSALPLTFPEPRPAGPPRVSLLLDRLAIGDADEHSAVLASLALTIARQSGAPLRVLTHAHPPAPTAFEALLARYNLRCDRNPIFDVLAPTFGATALGIADDERAVVGNLASAWLASQLLAPRRVIYVVRPGDASLLDPSRGDQRASFLLATALALVFTSPEISQHARLPPALGAAAHGATLTLSDPAWTPDWHWAIERFVADWLSS